VLKIPIELLNRLLTNLQSNITPTSHPFSSHKLHHTEFSHIERMQYIYKSRERHKISPCYVFNY
jgi:hypothetical protein